MAYHHKTPCFGKKTINRRLVISSHRPPMTAKQYRTTTTNSTHGSRLARLPVLLVLALLSTAKTLSEEGYLYSVDEKKFIDYENGPESLVYLTHRHMPRTLRMVEKVPGKVQFETENGYALDSSRSTFDLILYDKHDNWNQQFTIETMPHGMIKLRVGEKCMSTERNMKYLTEMDCDTYANSPGQFFKWISVDDEDVVREFIEECGGHNSRRRHSNDRDKDRDRDRDRDYDGRDGRRPGRGRDRDKDRDRDDYVRRPGRGRDHRPDRGHNRDKDVDRDVDRDRDRDYLHDGYRRRHYIKRDDDSTYDSSTYDNHRRRSVDHCLGIDDNGMKETIDDLRALTGIT